MGRTPAGNRWRFRHDLPAAVVQQLEPLCRAEPSDADLTRLPRNAPRNAGAIRAVLAGHALIEVEYGGPAYWVPAQTETPANVVRISPVNADRVAATFPWLVAHVQEPALGPVTAALWQGAAVAVCFCSRIPGRATEAGVETLPAYRGRGFATAAVRGWVSAVRARGILPLYSTAWDNLASQAIAAKLGMVRYAADWSVR